MHTLKLPLFIFCFAACAAVGETSLESRLRTDMIADRRVELTFIARVDTNNDGIITEQELINAKEKESQASDSLFHRWIQWQMHVDKSVFDKDRNGIVDGAEKYRYLVDRNEDGAVSPEEILNALGDETTNRLVRFWAYLYLIEHYGRPPTGRKTPGVNFASPLGGGGIWTAAARNIYNKYVQEISREQ